MDRFCLFFGPLLAACAVVLGALQAHMGLDDYAADLMKTAQYYHLIHAVGLFGIGIYARLSPHRLLGVAAILMVAGLVFFCGSLYTQALWDWKPFAFSAPFGGSSFILAWLVLATRAFFPVKSA